ncbi:AT-rich interactive domain-containing protein 1-like [Rhododendron vialii]|uniref:AT-rich interactive domain-containing protein 1-like n=1 Tax=Rhododendron vialii TaxID=182163 RepID=UPI00265F94CB|nr:AT-rich interactive domain-containing protein 1-like [Rhododendron vialii]XP_058223358.1 AT-rich interactive domain-containing protein 1-like [Rhododendron vialii]
MEFEPEFRGSSSEISDQKNENGDYLYLDLEESDMDSMVGKLSNGNEVIGLVESDESRKGGEDCKNLYEGEECMISGSSVFSNRKRKRGCRWRMLDWVVEVAKNPCDPEVVSLPERPDWKQYGREQLWKQVLLARHAMFLKRNGNRSPEQKISNWLKQRMHPSMYDDHSGSERQRSSQRLVSAKESRSLSSKIRPRSDSSSSTQTQLEDYLDKESETLSTNSVFTFLNDNQNRKRVPVGPFFQANVLEWTGETCESDSRWLGSRVWPVESGEPSKYLIERDRIGKGRQESCGCENPGSIECVRFHVSEKRVRVKLELGLAFLRLKFDRMGEEVALSWTKEEEKRFQEIIKSNPASLDMCFWDEIVKSFTSKKREDLVSYYFNVYLLRRRGYQNRSTPSNIESDDEESEFGPVTNRYRHDALKSPGSIFCSPKKPHSNVK